MLLTRGRPLRIVIAICALCFGCDHGTSGQPAKQTSVSGKPPVDIAAIKQTRINPVDGAVMVWIPPGKFTMGGTEYVREKPPHKVNLTGYWIYKYPVTVKQFRKFCNATSYKFEWNILVPGWGWKDDHPIVNVSWDDAHAYCLWSGTELPSEAQWEKAARGPKQFRFAWGNSWDSSKLCCMRSRDEGTCAVYRGSHISQSGYGCMDMSGNVRQWCQDNYDETGYHYSVVNDPIYLDSSNTHAIRNGSWTEINSTYFRCSERTGWPTNVTSSTVGFRCSVNSR